MRLKQRLASLKPLFLEHDATSSLRSRALHSGTWIGAGFALQKGLQLASNLILTRLLFPEAFGLMALATVFLVGLAMFSDIGLRPSIIRDPRNEADFLNTAWTIQIVRGLLLCIIGATIAYPISLFYGQPILFPLLAVLSTTAAISGFASIGLATAERGLDFRRITTIQVLGQIASIGLLIVLAYFWRSVWALAVANVISTGVIVAIGYAILPKHQHRLKLDPVSVKSLVNFGRWVLLSTVATFLGGEGLKAIQGGLISPAEFGVLAIGYTIAAIPNDLATRLSNSIGLPVLAETYRNAPKNARSILHALRKRTLAVSFAMFAGVILSAEPVIAFLYDSRYHSAGTYVVALSFANGIAAVGLGYTSAILAIGKGSSYFCIMAAFAVLRIAGVVLGFESYGIVGMLYGIGIANLFATGLIWTVAYRVRLLDIQLDLSILFVLALVSGIEFLVY